MARDFNAASDKLKRTSVPSTATNNFTICCWVNIDTLINSETAFVNGFDGGSGVGYWLGISSTNTPRFNYSFVVAIDGGTALSTGRWYHFLGIRNAGTGKVYLNGVDEGVSSASVPFAPSTTLAIGMNQTNAGADGNPFDGKVCECAIWDRALSASEITQLGQGYAPSFFPQSLVFYAPVTGANNPEIDKKSTTTLTVTGTTRATHPDFMKYPNKPNTGIVIKPRAFSPGLAR